MPRTKCPEPLYFWLRLPRTPLFSIFPEKNFCPGPAADLSPSLANKAYTPSQQLAAAIFQEKSQPRCGVLPSLGSGNWKRG